MKKFVVFITTFMFFLPTLVNAEEDLDAKYAVDLLKPGMPAPAIEIEIDGQRTINLLDIDSPKYIILEFWASWCGDCRRDMPKVRKLYNAINSDSVMIQGYSFDKDSVAWQRCVKDSALVWAQAMSPVTMRNSSVGKEYHLNWIPSYYLIDPQGRVALSTVIIEKIANFLREKGLMKEE